jgi:hypothetical protein
VITLVEDEWALSGSLACLYHEFFSVLTCRDIEWGGLDMPILDPWRTPDDDDDDDDDGE